MTSWQQFWSKNKELGYDEALRRYKRMQEAEEDQAAQIAYENHIKLTKAIGGFSTGGGSFPKLQTPELAGELSSDTAVVLTWDAIEWNSEYQVEIDTDSGFASPTLLYFGPNLTTTASGLSAATIYYFRIRATNLPSFPSSDYDVISIETP